MVETIQQQLADRGLKRVRVRGDGNCQFRAVAASFANTKLNVRPSHRALRKEAVEYIARHHTHYKDFIWDQSFEDFLRNQKKDKTYGDNLTLDAMARIYDLKIIVLRDQRKSSIENPDGMFTITLIYTGDDGDDAHYDATAPVDRTLTTNSRHGVNKKTSSHERRETKRRTRSVRRRSKRPNSSKRKTKTKRKARRTRRKSKHRTRRARSTRRTRSKTKRKARRTRRKSKRRTRSKTKRKARRTRSKTKRKARRARSKTIRRTRRTRRTKRARRTRRTRRKSRRSRLKSYRR